MSTIKFARCEHYSENSIEPFYNARTGAIEIFAPPIRTNVQSNTPTNVLLDFAFQIPDGCLGQLVLSEDLATDGIVLLHPQILTPQDRQCLELCVTSNFWRPIKPGRQLACLYIVRSEIVYDLEQVPLQKVSR